MTTSAGPHNRSLDDGSPLLVTTGLSKSFGGLRAVSDVSLSISRRERRALIGPNGAGKSTLFKLIAGRITPTTGRIEFEGSDITSTSEDRRIREGMAVTFQTSELFDSLSVNENLALAVRRHRGLSTRWFRPATSERVDRDVMDLLDRFELGDLRFSVAADLSHGQRRHLEIALAFAGAPSLLLLDEPVAGMSLSEATAFVDLVAVMDDVAIVIIEHNLDVVAQVASEVSVLDAGRLIANGTPQEIAASEVVQAAYLGSEHGRSFTS